MSSRKRHNHADAHPANGTDEKPAAENAETKPVAPVVEYEPTLPLERLGDMLRRVREQRRDNLQHIAEYLCIRRGFLQALEDSHYDELPADAYAIGFLRSYANYLGLDDRDVIDRYRHEMEGRRKKPILMVPTPISEGRTPSALIIIGTIGAAILVYGLWYMLSVSDSPAVTALPLPSTESTTASDANVAATNATVTTTASPAPLATTNQTASAPASTPAPTTISATTAPLAITPTVPSSSAATPSKTPVGEEVQGNTATTGSHIVIKAEQSSWIMISDGKGKTIFDHVLKPGEIYKVPDVEGLTLTTGNGGGIVLSLDGVELPKLAEGSSHVLHNVPIDAAHLKTLGVSPGD